MTCHEARKLLYDRQVSRSSGPEEERATVFALAQAHLAVCLACNEYFELERAFLGALKERIVPLGPAMPASVLSGALERIHNERMTAHNDAAFLYPEPRPSFVERFRSLFRRR